MVVRRHDGGIFGTFWGTYDDFWQETSISGISNAGKARGGKTSIIRRIVWLLIFTFFFIFTMYNVVDIMNDYFEYGVSYSVYVKHENQVI